MAAIRVICGALLIGAWAAGSANAQDPQLQFLARAAETVTTLRNASDMGPPLNGNLADATAVLVLPRLLKASFIIGGKGGNGVVLTRLDDGTWSAPAFVEFAGPSIGLQLGAASSQAIFVAMTDRARDRFKSGSFTFGGGIQVAMFVVGAGQQAGQDVYGSARSRGIALGLNVSGTTVTEKANWNQAFHEKAFKVDEIVGNLDLIDERSDGLRNALSEPAS